MGTRRPMSRTSSTNGRYYDSLGSSNGSASESDDSNGSAYSPRPDSRNYLLNVRPENSRSSFSRYSSYTPGRTTFCSIISQLTEETQPCFETTLKPKAVSEGCDAKFICMVSGYPEPEVTWYKDDEEMDRYCGLPKYEIFRNGNRHTLQIYNCLEEDAAIYQASARNNKGIVSCSGVLEVGTMTEYEIHQRWFAKLKRKAEAKMREIEQSRRRVKENLEEGEKIRALSPERIQRKRRFSTENKQEAAAAESEKEDLIKVHIQDANSRLQEDISSTEQQPHNGVNGFTELDKSQEESGPVVTNGYTLSENVEDSGKEFLAYVYETVEVITKKPTAKESYAKKKKKEEDPPVSKAETKREDAAPVSIQKKAEGISPAPRRSRINKDHTRSADEKMEIQPTQPTVTANRRFAINTALPKVGKTISKDIKKPKESVAPPIKTADATSSRKDPLPPNKDDIFSLKDMYFGESLQVTQEEKEEKKRPSNEVQKSEIKVSSFKQGRAISTKCGPQTQVSDPPKAAPRRSREQRELLSGSTSQKASTQCDALVGSTPLDNQGSQEVKPVCEVLQQPIVESKPEPSSPINSHSISDIPEQKLLEQVPSLRLPEREIQEPEVLNKSRITSEDLPEEKSQTETSEKLKFLEMEYMALQKAYALLQHQLELNQKTEEEKMKTKEVTESQENIVQKQNLLSEQNQMEMQKNRDESNVAESLNSPVFMETDEAIKTEVDGIPQKEVDHENNQGLVSSLSQQSTDFLIECCSEKGLDDKGVCLNEPDSKVLKENIIFPLGLSQEETIGIEGDDHHSNKCHGDSHEDGEENPRSAIVSDSKVEKMEGIKETKQVDEKNEIKLEEILASDEQNPNTLLITPTSENTNQLILLDVDLTKMETSIRPSITVPPFIESIDDVQELSISEGILETNIPGATSAAKSLAGDTNQSVVTLLRDVKAALESGIVKDVECPSESSSSSGLSPLAISSPEEYFVEPMLPLSSEEEKNIIQHPVMPELETIPINIQAITSEIEESAKVLQVPSSPEHQTNEEAQSEMIPKEQSKQDHSLVTTLKNSLLKLFHIKPADDVDHNSEVNKESNQDGEIQVRSPEEMASTEGNVSPMNSSKTLTTDAYHFQKRAESSTSGKVSPTLEVDIPQNADSLQTSPDICRKASESSKKGITQAVHSAPLTPTISRSSRVLDEEFVLNKDDLNVSPSTAQKSAGKICADSDFPSILPVPSIVVGSLPAEKTLGNLFSDFEKDNSRKWRSSENLSFIPSATPQELASGARRKIYLPKSKQLEETETGSTGSLTPPSKRESPSVSPGQTRRSTSLLSSQPQQAEKCSPVMARRMTKLEVPKIYDECAEKEGSSEDPSVQTVDSDILPKEDIQPDEPKKSNDPYKAPQVIRKIRAEQFSDASGNLKLWCQFFNILSDSIITWYKDEVQVAKVNRSCGDEGQVALAIVQASTKDCGVYQCTIDNDYGTDSTDCLLSAEILSAFISKEEAEVGEEIEMTQMVFAKGLADSGYWGDKFFGRIAMENAHVGEGFLRKSCRAKAIYGLEPIFDSGKTCIIKIKNLIPFGTKNESTLVEKNYEITIQECKIQNTTREYCKIFAAECRAVSGFGQVPEIVPLNLIYRPANNIPYATIEEDLEGRFQKYCIRDQGGKLHVKNSSETEQKCCTFQHWVYQWTNGNMLVTTLEGVGWKLTNIGIATKSKGYQGLKESCFPSVLDEFPLAHQCNRYCEMLGLKSLKASEGLQPPAKAKASRSPIMSRKTSSGQSSPQIQKKGLASPQTARKGGVSPKITRKATDTGDAKTKGNHATTAVKSQ